MLCYCHRFLPHRVGLAAVTAAASDSPSAHYSAYQGLGCDGGGIKPRTPDAFLHRSSSSFQHFAVHPQALLDQMVYMWTLEQLLGYTGFVFLCARLWNTSTQKWQENLLMPPWIQRQRHYSGSELISKWVFNAVVTETP